MNVSEFPCALCNLPSCTPLHSTFRPSLINFLSLYIWIFQDFTEMKSCSRHSFYLASFTWPNTLRFTHITAYINSLFLWFLLSFPLCGNSIIRSLIHLLQDVCAVSSLRLVQCSCLNLVHPRYSGMKYTVILFLSLAFCDRWESPLWEHKSILNWNLPFDI